jgi:allantoate deiminase
MKAAHQQLERWMKDAGLDCQLDAVGNLIGQPAASNHRPIFMIGSHLDTVVNAGRFDGALGILLGLGMVELFKDSGFALPFDIHVVAFSEEEGVRYRFPFVGSLGISGSFCPLDFDRQDLDGITLADALREFGCDPEALNSANYADRNLIGFMEGHIEQATVLEDDEFPVGIVSSIAGQTRALIVLEGTAGHAGTVPHDRRHDALAAAAEIVLEIERLGQSTSGLFATVGNVVASPGLSNVICGRAELRLDLRHASDESRTTTLKSIENLVQKVARSRHISGSIVSVESTPAVQMDRQLSRLLKAAMVDCGLGVKSMVSGAGHDAMIMAQATSSCMLFIRCRGGVSHHPDEFVSLDDIQTALRVMVNALIRLAHS